MFAQAAGSFSSAAAAGLPLEDRNLLESLSSANAHALRVVDAICSKVKQKSLYVKGRHNLRQGFWTEAVIRNTVFLITLDLG